MFVLDIHQWEEVEAVHTKELEAILGLDVWNQVKVSVEEGSN